MTNMAVRGSAVGWGTALKAGKSRVRFPVESFEFFCFAYIILRAALWLSLYQGSSLVGDGGLYVGRVLTVCLCHQLRVCDHGTAPPWIS